ncbi:MAG TPA: zinc-binding dehydrogenase [Nocardioides sp.]|nr:zinc-binding dehydrogenase [Nocardioides sp.]
MTFTSLELRSEITADGHLRLSLEENEVGDPGPDEVVIRVEATPINPSDLAQLLGPADLDTLESSGTPERPVATASIPAPALPVVAGRVGKSLVLGNEAAGTVVAAGANAQHLLGKVVSAFGGKMYSQYRTVPAFQAYPFPDGITPEQGASAFVNPLTALGMVSTMRLEGHTALVHTAAASNLGQMLTKLCVGEGIGLVNVVRSAQQEQILRDLGATHVVNSTADDFRDQLQAAIAETGATLAFDAVGGGPLGGQILAAMEAVLLAKNPEPGPYGSTVKKQLYVYGRLDRTPTTIPISVGMAWSAGGWLLMYHLMRIGPEETMKLRARVADEITTTFASHYTDEISLAEAVDPATIRRYGRMATGEKFLLRP